MPNTRRRVSQVFHHLRMVCRPARLPAAGWLAAVLCWLGAMPVGALEPGRPLREYVHRQWNVEHGLPHAHVHAVAQTAEGYLWLATENGLARFNGGRFLAYPPPEMPAIPQPFLNCLLAEADGTLWVGSEFGGLARLREGEFAPFSVQGKALIPRLFSLCRDRGNRLWLGTGEGLWLFAQGKLRPVALEDCPTNTIVDCLLEDSQGRVWCGTHRGLLGPVAAGGDAAPLVSALSRNRVYSLAEDGQGGLWVGTDAGLFGYRGSTAVRLSPAQGLQDERVLSLHRDRQDVLWVGTPQGVNRVIQGRVVKESAFPPLQDLSVHGFLEDGEGNFWIATSGGLQCLRDPVFTAYSARSGLNSETALSVAEYPAGTLWIGTMEAGLFRLQNGAFQHHGDFGGMAVNSLAPDRDGGLWVGTRRDGLHRLIEGRTEHHPFGSGVLNSNILSLAVDEDRTVWVGTGEGLLRYQEQGFVQVLLPGEGRQPSVRDVRRAYDGSLWVASSRGLYNLAPERTNWLQVADGLPADLVYLTHEDADRRLWLGTARGIACRLPDGWHRWPATEREGRVHAFWLAEDRQGFLWCASQRGIWRIRPQTLLDHWRDPQNEVEVRAFTHADGLLAMECLGGRQPAGCVASDGRLWFLTRRGPAVVDPQVMPYSRQPPRTLIERILVDGKPHPLRGELRFPPGTRSVAIQYASLSFAAPEKVRFRYRLEGSGEAWIEAGNQREVSYARLAPGAYRFEVQSCNHEGIWSVPGASLAFHLAPYWHQTRWFWPLVAGATLALAGVGHWLRMRVARRRHQELELLVTARTRELEHQMAGRLQLEERLRLSQKMEAVGQLAAGVAHYFNNLLTIIRAHADLLGEPVQTPEENRESLQAIQQASHRAAELVRQLLAFSERHMLSSAPLDLLRLVRRAEPKLKQTLGPGIELRWELPPDVPLIQADSAIVEQVLLSLASNARDAMPNGGQFVIGVVPQVVSETEAGSRNEARPGAFVVLSLTDTGVGMPPEVLHRAFEPFFTTKEIGRGVGLGLSSVYGIVRQHGGWTEVTSTVGQGTAVRLFFPVAGEAPERR